MLLHIEILGFELHHIFIIRRVLLCFSGDNKRHRLSAKKETFPNINMPSPALRSSLVIQALFPLIITRHGHGVFCSNAHAEFQVQRAVAPAARDIHKITRSLEADNVVVKDVVADFLFAG